MRFRTHINLIHVLGGLGGTLTGLSVLDVLVSDGQFAKVRADHIELNFHWKVLFSVVDGDDASNHGRHDNSISESGLNGSWSFSRGEVQLRLFDSLDELEVGTLDSVASES